MVMSFITHLATFSILACSLQIDDTLGTATQLIPLTTAIAMASPFVYTNPQCITDFLGRVYSFLPAKTPRVFFQILFQAE